MTHPPPASTTQGFTLMELLIGLTVLGILLGIAAPAMLQWKQKLDADNFLSALASDFNVSRTRTTATGQLRRIRLVSSQSYIVENQAVGASTWTTVLTGTSSRPVIDLSVTVARTFLFDTRGFMVATTAAGTAAGSADIQALNGSGQKKLSVTALGLARRQ